MNKIRRILSVNPDLKWSFHLIAQIILGLWIVLLYLIMFKNTLTNWDDELYILYNPYLRNLSFESLRNIFSSYFAGNYHPLTMVLMALGYQAGGIQPWPYQLTNLVLHVGNTILVYHLVRMLMKWHPSGAVKKQIAPFITAFLFGIHTLQVESVAWISEQKTVLYAFFFFSSIIMYLKYITDKSKRAYIFSIILFIFALLSKGMAVTLSVCVIAIDYFAGRDLLSKKVISEKIPFLVLSLLFGYIALMAQHSGSATDKMYEFSWIGRASVAGYGFINYLLRLCFPYRLSAYYPYPVKAGETFPNEFYLCLAIALVILFIVWRYFRKHKVIIFGSIFFVINISIVLQLLPVGDAVMADRYVYIASIGFFFVLGYLVDVLWQKYISWRSIILAIFAMYGIVISVKTFNRIGVWKNSLTLWDDSLAKYPVNNDRGFLNRGSYYFDAGEFSKALNDFEMLMQIDPRNSGAYIGMGRIKQVTNDMQGAMLDFCRSLQLRPSYEAYIDRSVLKFETGDTMGALADLDSASFINPLRIETYINRGGIYYANGNYVGALENYQHILKFDKHNSLAYLGMALAKQALNDMEGAMNDFNALLSIEASYDGYINRAILGRRIGYVTSALEDLDRAIKIESSRADAFINKGQLLYESGNYDGALKAYNKGLQIDPQNTKVYLGMGLTKQALNDMEGAMIAFNISLSLEPSYEGYIDRAVLKKGMGEYRSALSDLDTAVQIDSLRTGAYLNKGKIFFEIRDFEKAEFFFDKVLWIDSLNNHAYIGKGLLKQTENNYSGAMEYFNLALSASKTYEGYLNRAVLKMKLKNIEGAWEDLENASQINPSGWEAYINKGIIEMNYGNNENALKEFTTTLTVYPGSSQAYLYRAIVRIRMADYEGAVADLDESILLVPHGDAFYYRGIAKFQLGYLTEGCIDLNQAISLGYHDAKAEVNKYCK